MKTLQLSGNKLNTLGEFQDKNLENEFLNQEIKKAMNYIKPIILMLGLLYTAFIIQDFFVINSSEKFRIILVCRVVFMLSVFLLLLRLNHINNRQIITWVTFYETYAAVMLMFICYEYGNVEYLIQSLGIMVMILAFFIVPNRWVNMILVSMTALVLFAVVSLFFEPGVKASHITAGIVYNVIVLILGAVNSFRSHYQKRINFINNKELIRLSTTDTLTGIHNRAKFDEELSRCVTYSKRYGAPLSLIIFDFDNFKDINDTYGHPAGDKVMIETVAIISRRIRETDIFARWGGEEFVLLLPNTVLKATVGLAERLRVEINGYGFYAGHVTCSFGVVELAADETAENLVNRADKLLYSAKNEGRNRVKS